MQSGYKEEFSWEELSRVLRCQPAKIWAWEQLEIELKESAVEGDWEETARRELACEKKTSCVIWSDSEIRLVKTENTSACATVNCKMCRSEIVLYCLQSWVEILPYQIKICEVLQDTLRVHLWPYVNRSLLINMAENQKHITIFGESLPNWISAEPAMAYGTNEKVYLWS
jgi:hypothetical protein